MQSNVKFLILIIPFIEVALLAKLVSAFGFFVTLGFLLLSASTGLTILRLRGFSALLRARDGLQRGELLKDAMLRDAISALGGVLLIVPGPLTDALGALMQIPLVQDFIGQKLIQALSSSADLKVYTRSNTIIEGQYRRDPTPSGMRSGPSGPKDIDSSKGDTHEYPDRRDNP